MMRKLTERLFGIIKNKSMKNQYIDENLHLEKKSKQQKYFALGQEFVIGLKYFVLCTGHHQKNSNFSKPHFCFPN